MKILVVGSLYDVELNTICDALKNKTVEQGPLCTFYEGTYMFKEIIVCQTKIGLLQSSAAVTYAINKVKPDFIIDIGCANGFLNMNQGDVVVGLTSINITSFKTETKKQGEGCDPKNWKLVNYIYGEREKLIEQRASQILVEKFKEFEMMKDVKNINYGVIGSGDIINREYDRIEYLADNYNVLCEDMSAIAVYTIANELNVPAISIKIVAGNEASGVDIQREQGLKLQPLVLKFIEYLNK